MTLDEAIKRYTDNAEYERTHGNLQGCLEFKQLAEWLRKYQKIQEIISDFRKYQKGISCGFGGTTYMQMISEVVEDGNDDK